MVKRFHWLLIGLLLVMLPGLAFAANRVTDDAGIFTAEEIQNLEQMIEQIRNTYQVDAAVLTTRDVMYTSDDTKIQDYADLYYEEHGYGIGEDKAGVIYMIDMTNRAPVISTSGVMIDYINDRRLERLFDAAVDYLRAGNYGGAAQATLSLMMRYLQEGVEEGQFRYDSATGKRLSGLYNKLTTREGLLGAVAGAIASLLSFLGVKSSYNLKGSTYKYNAAAACQSHFILDRENFLRQRVTRTRIPQNTGGGGGGGFGGGSGSSVHTSSSGGSHGGGVGGRF